MQCHHDLVPIKVCERKLLWLIGPIPGRGLRFRPFGITLIEHTLDE